MCCADAWGGKDQAHIINKDLPKIQKAIAEELGLTTIPFLEAIGEYNRDVLQSIRSYYQDDSIHPNEGGYKQMAAKAVKVLNRILKSSPMYATTPTDEAATGGKWTAGLAVVAVGMLFAVFAAVSRKGRRGLAAGAKGYGAVSVDALPMV